MTDPFTAVQRKVIVSLAARYRVPVVYPYQSFPVEGGLMSYGANIPDLFRRSASYVGRILGGAMPRDLPVQQPTKFELVINLKTAKMLGLDVPPSLLAIADAVIDWPVRLLHGGILVLTHLRHWAAQDFRSAKSIVRPSTRRDIVPSIAWA